MGKIMRGVNIFNPYGIGGDSQTPGVPYQGRSDTDTSHIYYDVVGILDATGNISELYYCEHFYYDGHPAQYYTPGVTPGWQTVWVAATQFDFVATKVLLADNAYIDVLTGNGMYLYGNTGAGGATPYVVAGSQGGSTTEWPPESGNIVSQVNFFAGAHFNPDEDVDLEDDTNVYPQTAPFRVYYDGSFVSTEGRVGGYTYNEDGLTYYRNATGSNQGYHCIYQKDSFEILWRNAQGTNRVAGDVVPSSASDPIMEISRGIGQGVALEVSGYPAIDATGDILRNGESVITFNADASTPNYPDILHVVHCSQSDYDAMESGGTLDPTTFYIIS